MPFLKKLRLWGSHGHRPSRGSSSRPQSQRVCLTLEVLEDRTILNYSVGPAPYVPLPLQPGDPGVFSIIDNGNDVSAAIDLGTNQLNFYGNTYSGPSSLFASSNS